MLGLSELSPPKAIHCFHHEQPGLFVPVPWLETTYREEAEARNERIGNAAAGPPIGAGGRGGVVDLRGGGHLIS